MLNERSSAENERLDDDLTFALVPVKDLWQAKQRLSSMLSAAERRALCLAMLGDVLSALKAARELRGILVYSSDEDALALARELGIPGERELCARGQSEAVSAAIPVCRERGATSVLTIPLDAPLLLGDDVDALVGFHRAVALPRPSAIMVPSMAGTGTNALYLTPPECLKPHFGPDSLALHVREARRLGVAHRQFVLPRLALDVDCPDDLLVFLDASEQDRRTNTRSYQHLLRTGVARRCRLRAG